MYHIIRWRYTTYYPYSSKEGPDRDLKDQIDQLASNFSDSGLESEVVLGKNLGVERGLIILMDLFEDVLGNDGILLITVLNPAN
ncbi:hypothetical protein CEXT_241221 [Caerostris extrusa]|uniref:Uncharacterized protein n=1 Tax=Caerostris extrusa TaxID=172846 RepID=A0AAV4N8T1_CAEEX|nr:hypothetical protein CEXT_241221 [Caerostris extrusa]